MTDEERFLEVLSETYSLLVQLGDLKEKAVVIGGQVIALHALATRGRAEIQVTTDTGVTVTRGFTHEPDLLFELADDEFTAERLVEVLKERGYRWHRGYRWGKTLPSGVEVLIDFFRSPELAEESQPLQMTALPDAEQVFPRTERLVFRLGGSDSTWRIPDAFGFLTMKVRAKRQHRPAATKDCFDLFVFVKLMGPGAVNASLDAAPQRSAALRDQLSELFWDFEAPGVRDVLHEAGLADSTDRELLAREVVDLFAAITAR